MPMVSPEVLPNAEPAPRHEDDLRELEGLVQRIESGQLPLEELLQAYRRGAELLTRCRARLDAVEQQVRLLDDGELKPWTPS